MADDQKFVQNQNTNLAGAGATLGDTSVTLVSLTRIDGTPLTMTDFGTKGFGTLEPGNGTQEEAITFSGITQNIDGTAILTGVKSQGTISPYTETTGLAITHPGGSIFIITNTAGFYNELASTENDETILGTWTFTNPNYPRMDAATPPPIDDEQLATKKYVDDTAGGIPVSINRTVVSATAGETVVAGNALYLDETDNEWKKTSASASATSENQQLGIAQGAGTNGNAIAGGVLLLGRDSFQSGGAQGDPAYLSNTSGLIQNTPGTKSVQVGTFISATEIDFTPYYYKSVSTQDEKNAMVGSSGTPSSSNKFITEDDVSATGASGKIIRASGTTLPAGITAIARRYYGDGAQGALTTTGATTINATKTNVNALSSSGQAVLSVAATTGIVAGDHVLIHQSRGTGAGLWEIRKVLSVQAAVSLTMTENLVNSYQSTGAQVILIPEHTTMTFKTGTTISDTEWAGTTGGIVVAYASNGVFVEDGVSISLNAFGFRGGATPAGNSNGNTGEGTVGASVVGQATANGNGGGGGDHTPVNGGFGGGGGNQDNGATAATDPGVGGNNLIDAISTHITGEGNVAIIFGGGGGSGGNSGGVGGDGGGIIILIAPFVWVGGAITSNGANGATANGQAGGGGAGGSVVIFTDQLFGLSNITVTAGAAGGAGAGAGSAGVIIVGYPKSLPTS